MLIVGIDSAGACVRVKLPAETAVDFFAFLKIVVPVGTGSADTATLRPAPGLCGIACGTHAFLFS